MEPENLSSTINVENSTNVAASIVETVKITPSLPKIKEVLSEAWSIFRNRLWTLVAINLIPAVFILVAGSGLFGFSFFKFRSFENLSPSELAWLISIGVLIFIISLILQMWTQIALILAINGHAEKISLKTAYKNSKSKIISYFWLSFITGIIMVGSFILFLIPGFIFTIWFVFSIMILILEDVRGMNALLKSRDYVKGHFFKILLYMFVIGLFFVVLNIISEIVSSGASNIYKEIISIFIIPLISYVFLTPFAAVYMYVVYSKVKQISDTSNFVVTKKRKAKYLATGIIGILLLPSTIIYLAVYHGDWFQEVSNSLNEGYPGMTMYVDEQDGFSVQLPGSGWNSVGVGDPEYNPRNRVAMYKEDASIIIASEIMEELREGTIGISELFESADIFAQSMLLGFNESYSVDNSFVVNVDGVSAFEILFSGVEEGGKVQILYYSTVKNKKVYALVFTSAANSFESNRVLFDQVVKSFKFK